MSDIAIKIENLAKRYRYGGAAPLSYNLRADLTDWVRGIFRRSKIEDRSSFPTPISQLPSPNSHLPTPTRHPTLHEVHEKHLDADPSYFWALKDINLEVRQGEVIGIIGQNGSGKSTLLKILSRITPPTIGEIMYNGRIASLLEVGTGFHRELTGRENIFLNGSILGMKRAEITNKFDEIVAFAEVEKFIDTPVKFYSSGMYVRLAFAVAAHLEPEILVVDEVLAVGDASFQKKCLGKMGDVAKQGRTILFVSHNLAAVQALCSKAIVLEKGRLKFAGAVSDALDTYLQHPAAVVSSNLSDVPIRTGVGDIKFSRLTLTDAANRPLQIGVTGETLKFHLQFTCRDPARTMRSRVGIGIRNQLQTLLVIYSTELTMSTVPVLGNDTTLVCSVPRLPLGGGSYGLVLFLEANGVVQDLIEEGLLLSVRDSSFFGTGCNFPHGWEGKTILVDHDWQLNNAT